jgi:hypothetical protein
MKMRERVQLTDNTVLARNHTRFLVSALGEETVMMNLENGDYLGINPVGTAIWHLLEQPATPQQLIAALMNEYEVSQEQCTQEVNAFLQQMIDNEVVIISAS